MEPALLAVMVTTKQEATLVGRPEMLRAHRKRGFAKVSAEEIQASPAEQDKLL